MTTLANKIDFIGFITVDHANPNGDPLNGNQPRSDYDGYGEISDVCIKRKIRNRLQDMGERILVQSDDRCDDGCDSIETRVVNEPAMEKPILTMKENSIKGKQEFAAEACKYGLTFVLLVKCLLLRKRFRRVLSLFRPVCAGLYPFIRQSV